MAHDTDPLLKAVQPNSNNDDSSTTSSFLSTARTSLSSLSSSFFRKTEDSVEFETLSVNGKRSDYTLLADDKKDAPVNPDNRFFDAVAFALLDMAEAQPNLRGTLGAFFSIEFNAPPSPNNADDALRIARKKNKKVKQLSLALRAKSKAYVDSLDDYTDSLEEKIPEALKVAFRDGTLRKTFQKYQLLALERPENTHVSFGQTNANEDSDVVFLKEGPVSSAEKNQIVQYFLTLPPEDAVRRKLADIIYNTFWDYVLEAPYGFRKILGKSNPPDENALRDYCNSDEAIKSYLFDDINHKAAIYYSRAFNMHYAPETGRKIPKDISRKEFLELLMERNPEMATFREQLGQEIYTIFVRHPEFQTPRFKNFIYDRPVRNEEEQEELDRHLKDYCESEEAISWYVFNTDYQKDLHYLTASKLLFASKESFLSYFTYSKVVDAVKKISEGVQSDKANPDVALLFNAKKLRESLYEHIAEALESCKEIDAGFKRPESYESLTKEYVAQHTEYDKEGVQEEIRRYSQSPQAFLWYVNTYLRHPKAGFHEEMYKLFQLISRCTINIWEKSADGTRKLTLNEQQKSQRSEGEIDLLIIPGSNPVCYTVLSRLNFIPYGDYQTFCNTQGKRAAETVHWVRKTVESQSTDTEAFLNYKKTIGTTRAGCPEIEGVMICEMLRKVGVPLSMAVTEYDKKSHPRSHTFVSQDGCIANLSDIDHYTDKSTLLLERRPNKEIPGDDFLVVLSPKMNGELEAFFDGDWSVNVEVHPSILAQLPLTVAETVETKNKAGKTGTKQIQPVGLESVQFKKEVKDGDEKVLVTVDGARHIDQERIHEIELSADPFIEKPVRTKTDEEIAREKFELADGKLGGTHRKDTIVLNEVLRRDGDLRHREAPENLKAVETPVEYSNMQPEKVFERPAPPKHKPLRPNKPVLLEKTVQSGFTHGPLQSKETELLLTAINAAKFSAVAATLPSWMTLGNSADDDFFDSIAQELNRLENTNTYDAAVIRRTIKCHEKDFNWENIAIALCEEFGVSIHVSLLDEKNKVTHLLFTKDNNSSENPKTFESEDVNWKVEKTLFLAAHTQNNNNPDEQVKMTTRFVPLTKKILKDNGLFKAVAEGLNNVIFGNTKVSKDTFYTDQYLRDACDDHLTHLPERNWVKAELNNDPAYVDYYHADGQSISDKGKEDAGAPEAKKRKVTTPYDIYRREVGSTEANKKTLPAKMDLEARLLCESLSAAGKKIQIQLFEVEEDDVADEHGVFHLKKVIRKHYLYDKNGRTEITDPKNVNWGSDKVVTLIYDKDNDTTTSCGSHLPRTWSFEVVNSFVHIFYGANLSLAMGMQALAAGAQAIMWGLSAEWVVSIMIGSGAGKWLLLWFYAFYKFGGFPSTLNNIALDIYNMEDHLKAMFEAFHTGNWSWASDVFPKIGGTALALFPALFFGGLNKLIVTGPQSFPATVLNNTQMFQGWASGMITLSQFINSNAEATYRLAFFSSFLGNMISARPIVEQIKRILDKCIRDAKNVRDKGVYENARFWLGILTGTGISVFVTMGFINFWQLSTGTLYAGIINADIPGAIIGYTLSAGIMAFIIGLGFCAAMPLGRKFSEYLFDVVAGDLQFQDGDFRKDNPEYQGFRAWWKEQTAAHQGMFIAAYAIAVGIVVAGAFPNVFQANLAGDSKFYAACAFLASMITELEGTETVFEKILHQIEAFCKWVGIKVVDVYEWLKTKSEELPFAVELKIRLLNTMEKHFPECCKPTFPNRLCPQRYGLFNAPPVAAALPPEDDDNDFDPAMLGM